MAGEYEVGQQLPGHRQLATAFGVSIAVIREALSRLVARDLLEIRAGQGTFVRQWEVDGDSTEWPGELSSEEELREVLELRAMLETEAAGLAALRAEPDEIATLERLIRQMAAHASDREAFLDADVAFHTALAEAARNKFLLRALLDLRTSMRAFLKLRAETTIQGDETAQAAVRDHEAIVAALRSRDPVGARDAVERIMRRAQQQLRDR
jgi:DNA-binding FadR family transcriptional regulator